MAWGVIGGAGISMPAGVASGCSLLPIRALGSALFRAGPSGRHRPLCGHRQRFEDSRGLGRARPQLQLRQRRHRPWSPAIPSRTRTSCSCAGPRYVGRGQRQLPATSRTRPRRWRASSPWPHQHPDRRPTRFSTSGAHVALSAPGERVLAASLGGICLVTGTSFAAPFVTAGALLRLARRAEELPVERGAACGGSWSNRPHQVPPPASKEDTEPASWTPWPRCAGSIDTSMSVPPTRPPPREPVRKGATETWLLERRASPTGLPAAAYPAQNFIEHNFQGHCQTQRGRRAAGGAGRFCDSI